MEGIITGSFVIFAMMFLLSLIFGRAFCGWVCPAGGLQECALIASNKKTKGGRLNWIKHIIWAPWIALIIFVAVRAGGLKKVDFLYQTVYGISVSNPQAYIIYYGVIVLIMVLAFTVGKRSFCHYVCWMAPFMIVGRKVSNVFKLPSLRLKADKEKCIHCKKCSDKCPMSLEVEEMVQNINMENAECILCGECVDVCPKKVINYSFKRM